MAIYDEKEMDLLGGILPGVSAALRTPLGTMHQMGQKMAAYLPEAEAQRLVLFEQGYYRALRVLSNLSMAPELVETDLFALEDTDLVSWLQEFIRQVRPAAELLGLTLELRTKEHFLVCGVHCEYLERALWNLVSNAMKFTPAGGTVAVILDKNAKSVMLSVQDNGCGISQELMSSVFDRWLHTDRLDPRPHGLGLGLPIARRVAEGHDGRLMLESREGEGTCVTLALPAVRCGGTKVEARRFDYTGGFDKRLLELSDALDAASFGALLHKA